MLSLRTARGGNVRADANVRNLSVFRACKPSTMPAWRHNTMSAREFLTNVTVILSVMALGALLETAVPFFIAGRHARGRHAANLGLTALSFLFNWLLSSVAAIAALTLRPTGVIARAGLPLWLQIAGGIVVLDFSVGYVSHRT